jgi:nitric oxide reductase NorQ protein
VSAPPFYLPIGDEVVVFTAAWTARLPVLLKGPTGCGKTRFVEYMAATLPRSTPDGDVLGHLVTVACHEDLTGSDLVGRYSDQGRRDRVDRRTAHAAVRSGAICYLDEVVEARKDTVVLIHPLTDHRRLLPIDKTGELLEAHPDFLLVLSYNPGYQSIMKDLKHSTRQRFVALEFGYPPLDAEARIIAHESRLDLDTALRLATLGEKVRHLRQSGLSEGVSTRLLVYAGQLIGHDVAPRRACAAAVSRALTDDPEAVRAIDDVAAAIFG